MLSTPLTRLLDIRLPIIGAPMVGAAGTRLARAITEAGGLGTVGISPAADLEEVGAELSALRESGTVFGVGLLGWALPRRPELLDLALDSGAAVVSMSFGDYGPALGKAGDAGVLLATQVGTAAEAVEAAKSGVDVIVARGGEGGGHGLNRVATLPLLQAILDDVDDGTPVVAAGGIGTGRGLAAVLAAGAAGAWIGTALLASVEAENSDDAKGRVLKATETDTVYTTAFDRALGLPWPEGVGGRALRNSFTDRWAGKESELGGRDSEASAEMRAAWASGNLDVAPLYAGQIVGSVTSRRPAGEIVADIATGAVELLSRWSSPDQVG